VIRLADLDRALRRSPRITIENLIVAESVDSTNTLARRIFDDAWTVLGPGPEVLIVALEQTAGRGRQGRSWVSRRGLGLYATLLLAVDEAKLQSLPLVVGVGLARGLEEVGCEARLKWPNDLQVRGRKLGGILIESISCDAVPSGVVDTTPEGTISSAPRTARASVVDTTPSAPMPSAPRTARRVSAAIVGFGVNHGHRATELPTPTSISLRQALDPLPSLERVAETLVAAVLAELERAGDADYAHRAYRERTVHRAGELLRCRVSNEDLEGVFLGFDERGFLRLEVNGRERRVASGEIVE
jgi:BirA family biotin operon repressor/biotin-[acetyl-CoA-carboxylase] ligase